MINPHFVWVLALAFGLPELAFDFTMHCGTKIVRIGDTAEYVRTHCGKPASIEHESKLFTSGATIGERCFTGSVNIERWTYKRSGGIPTVVTLVERKVERIRPQTGGFESGWHSPC